ncbi:permease [Fulvivirga maritima]|uniref:permease n=1 Tax=Fulvivirga maritima TaxID=2904247 RepID=UPI001F41DB14|nr:permease [Fulvivirga maritima]UII25475.1 permease [Fulvivirga maritima]
MSGFLEKWGESAYTTLGFFWSALWAFALGYIVSSMIQVFVTQDRMKKSMGGAGAKEVGLATFFGFISSSCSFAALATTKSLFKKGAGFIPSIAFLLASTNLVIELGIVISIFLTWQFVVGEYVGGLLLILISWVFIKLTKPQKLIKKVREKFSNEEEGHQMDSPDWRKEIKSFKGWHKVGMQYIMEWKMVWKDVTIGFTIAGIIAAFVPKSFYQTLFIGTGNGGADSLSFVQVLEHVLVGPVAAFTTFIGSMGNIPLASLLYSNGVSFAGVMAFIFSDLVVFPVLRINAKYYGWKMALYILLTLFVALIGSSLLLHYGFSFLDILPETQSGQGMQDQEHFKINYTFFLNIAFLAISGLLIWFKSKKPKDGGHHHGHAMADKGKLESILKVLAIIAYIWLLGGIIIKYALL